MRQRVDLYQVRFRRPRPALDARRCLLLLAAGGALLLSAWAQAAWRVEREEQGLVALRARLEEQSKRIVELEALHPPRVPDARLTAEVEQALAEREAKARLLELLAGERVGNSRGFSEHLAALARRRLEGLWLRSVQVRRGGEDLALAGSALGPELVPRLVRELAAEQAFAGAVFDSLRLERPEPSAQRIDFALATRAETAP